MNGSDISKRLHLAISSLAPNVSEADAQQLLVEAFGASDWNEFCAAVETLHLPETEAALSQTDYHSRMRHMLKCPRGEWEAEFERFKSLAVRAEYDFCAAHRNEDGWTMKETWMSATPLRG